MTEKELQDALILLNKRKVDEEAEIKLKYRKLRYSILKKWADENRRFDIDDIIEANAQIIKITGYYGETLYSGKPYVTYKGICLTKKLVPKKSGETTVIYDDGREIKKHEIKK